MNKNRLTKKITGHFEVIRLFHMLLHYCARLFYFLSVAFCFTFRTSDLVRHKFQLILLCTPLKLIE